MIRFSPFHEPTAEDPAVWATYERRWWTLTVVCFSLVIIVIDNTVLNVALPTISRELDAGATALQWMVDAYALVLAGLLLTGGALGDRYGRRGFLVLGLGVFGVASLLAAQASEPWQIIAARAVMGLGAALAMPATLSIITNVFPAEEQPKAIGIWAGLAGAGAAFGPILGGYLVDHFSWSAVFYINVPIVAVVVVAAYLIVPTSRDPEEHPLDPVGAVLSIAGLVALVYAVIEAPNHGWLSTSTLLLLATAIVLIGGFVAWERHTAHPMLPLHFFRNPRFSSASWTIMVNFMVMMGMFFVLTQYMQFVRGYTPIEAALHFMPAPLAMMATAAASARLVQRFGPRLVATAGMGLVILGLLGLSALTLSSGYPLVVASLVPLGIGQGLQMPPATTLIMSTLPPGKAGVGSAVNDTTREIGAALGIGIMGSVVASRYAAALDRDLTFVPRPMRAVAADGLGQALVAALRLGGDTGTRLADVARSAFISGMRVAMWVAALVLTSALVVAARYFPGSLDPASEVAAEAVTGPEREPDALGTAAPAPAEA
jgi:EmrB/QacA subfamily drug resistance transporter